MKLIPAEKAINLLNISMLEFKRISFALTKHGELYLRNEIECIKNCCVHGMCSLALIQEKLDRVPKRTTVQDLAT